MSSASRTKIEKRHQNPLEIVISVINNIVSVIFSNELQIDRRARAGQTHKTLAGSGDKRMQIQSRDITDQPIQSRLLLI